MGILKWIAARWAFGSICFIFGFFLAGLLSVGSRHEKDS